MFGMMFWCFVLNMFGVSWVGGSVKDTLLALDSGIIFILVYVRIPGTSTVVLFSYFCIICFILLSLSTFGAMWGPFLFSKEVC